MSSIKVSLVAALSADGFIAQTADHITDWTSKEDKKVFVSLTKRAGVMVMGRNTYDTIGKALPGRKTIVYTSRTLDNTEVETTTEDPAKLLKRLTKEGYQEVSIVGGQVVYDLFLSNGLVDTLYLTLEPKLFGSGIQLAKSSTNTDLKLANVAKLNDNVLLLQYEVQR